MIFLSILIFILAMSLRFFKTQITPIFFTRIAALAFIYSGVLTFNALHIQSIGSGIGIYSGLFQVTYYSLFFESFLYVIGAIVLLSWPLFYKVSLATPTRIRGSFDVLNSNGFADKESNLNTKRLDYGADLNSLLHVKSASQVLTPSLTNLNITEHFNFLNKTSNSVNGSGGDFEFISSITTSTESREYSLIALFSSLGGSLLLSSGDLLSMYLSIELQSFGLYILATIYRESGSATSAGLKYFLLGGLSSSLILLGIALVYTLTGLTSFESLYSLLSVLSISKGSFVELSSLVTDINQLSLESLSKTSLSLKGVENTTSFLSSSFAEGDKFIQGISLGLILIVVGFLFKIAGAPFHNWSPDVYDESPTNVTIWLTIMPKLSIVLLLLELEMGIFLNLSQPLIAENSGSFLNIFDYYNSAPVNIMNGDTVFLFFGDGYPASYVLTNIFILSSLLSLIIGTVVGLAQTRIKRLLAYSTVGHIGFILLALGISTEGSTESLIFYLIQYTITNLNAFFILLAFGYIINSLISSTHINSDIKFIFNLKGQFLANPILSLSLAVCLFSMAGIPPLIGFFGKQSVLFAAIGSGYFFMAFVAIVVSVISASYYLRIIRELHSSSPSLAAQSPGGTKPTPDPVRARARAEGGGLHTPLAVAHRDGDGRGVEAVERVRVARARQREEERESITILESEGRTIESHSRLFTIDNNGSSFVIGAANNTYLNLTNTHAFIISFLTLSIIFYVLKPSILLNSAVLSTLSLFYF